MMPSRTARHCSWCGKTHYIGDARGPGYCPTDRAKPTTAQEEEDRIWADYFEERIEHRERLADEPEELLFDERSVSDNDLPDSEFQKKFNGPEKK